MNDFYLKFPDQQTAEALLFADVEPVTFNESGVDVTQRKLRYDMALDVIGTIYKPTGEMLLGEDGEYPAMAPIDGWHVNVRGPEALELNPYVIEVKTPARAWA